MKFDVMSDYETRKGHLVVEVPFRSEQSRQKENHRSHFWVNHAPKLQTKTLPVIRLAGFEIEECNHLHLPFPCARVPYGSRLRTLGQQWGFSPDARMVVPNTLRLFRCLRACGWQVRLFKGPSLRLLKTTVVQKLKNLAAAARFDVMGFGRPACGGVIFMFWSPNPKKPAIALKQRIAGCFWAVLRPIFVSLALVGTGFAGPFEEGHAALSRHDYAAALRHFRTPAAEGDARAQHWLGFMDHYGAGVPQNYAIAAQWYLKAAEQGYALAQADLGLMYGGGKGVPQNYGEALKWFRLAADQGNDVAQYNLGIAFANAFGVLQNYIQAHMWLNLAMANTTEKVMRDEAARNRDLLATKMTSEQIAEAQRLATEWKPK